MQVGPLLTTPPALNALASPDVELWDVGPRQIGGIWLIDSGEVEEWRGDVLLCVRPQAHLLGDLEAIRRGPRDDQTPLPIATRWFVRTPTRARRVLLEDLVQALRAGGTFGWQVWWGLQRHASTWRVVAALALETFVRSTAVGLSPRVGPPPFVLPQTQSYLVPVEVPSAVLAQVPPRLTLMDGGNGVLLLRSHLRGIRSKSDGSGEPAGTFVEMAVGVPVRTPEGEGGLYLIWAFTDSASAMFVSRETFGQAKMYGRFSAGHEGGRFTLVGSVADQRSFEIELVPPPEGDQLLAGLNALRPLLCAVRLDGQPGPVDADPSLLLARMEADREVPKAGEPRPDWPRLGIVALSWKRSFRPDAVAAASVAWDPEDFEVDGIARSSLTVMNRPDVGLLGIARDGPSAPSVRFLQGEAAHEIPVRGDVAIHVWADLGSGGAAPHAGLELDYLELAEDLSEDERSRLAWGPEAWGEHAQLASSRVHVGDHLLERLSHVRVSGRPVAEVLAESPLWEREDPAQIAALVAELLALPGAGVRTLRPGETLDPGRHGEAYLWLVDGLIDAWEGPMHIGRLDCGQTVAWYDNRAELRSWGASRVVSLPRKAMETWVQAQTGFSGALARFLWLAVYVDVEGALNGVHALEEATYQVFPGARAVVLPGPYRAGRCVQYTIPILRSKWLESLLPPRVSWAPGSPIALITFTRFEQFGPAQQALLPEQSGVGYSECGVMIPSRVHGSSDTQLFVPFIFPTSLMAMLAGREIYGYPKSWATVVLDEEAGRLLVRRAGVQVLEVGHEPLRGRRALRWISKQVGRLLPSTPRAARTLHILGHKRAYAPGARVESPEEAATWDPDRWDVDQLASSGIVVTGLKASSMVSLTERKLTLHVPNGEAGGVRSSHTLQTFGVALRAEYAMELVQGSVPVDYLEIADELTAEERSVLAVI